MEMFLASDTGSSNEAGGPKPGGPSPTQFPFEGAVPDDAQVDEK